MSRSAAGPWVDDISVCMFLLGFAALFAEAVGPAWGWWAIRISVGGIVLLQGFAAAAIFWCLRRLQASGSKRMVPAASAKRVMVRILGIAGLFSPLGLALAASGREVLLLAWATAMIASVAVVLLSRELRRYEMTPPASLSFS